MTGDKDIMVPTWQQALQRVLLRWEGTPWLAGGCACGVGVDCVRFVVSVLDELEGVKGRLPPVAAGTALHRREQAMAAARELMRRWPNRGLERGEAIEPGDVLAVRVTESSGPGHVLLAGVPALVLWHAVGGAGGRPGVCRTGLGAARKQLLAAWRLEGREQWQ